MYGLCIARLWPGCLHDRGLSMPLGVSRYHRRGLMNVIRPSFCRVLGLLRGCRRFNLYFTSKEKDQTEEQLPLILGGTRAAAAAVEDRSCLLQQVQRGCTLSRKIPGMQQRTFRVVVVAVEDRLCPHRLEQQECTRLGKIPGLQQRTLQPLVLAQLQITQRRFGWILGVRHRLHLRRVLALQLQCS